VALFAARGRKQRGRTVRKFPFASPRLAGFQANNEYDLAKKGIIIKVMTKKAR